MEELELEKEELRLEIEALEERIAPGILNGDHINANVHPKVNADVL